MTDTDTPTDADITRTLAEMMGYKLSATPGWYFAEDGTKHCPQFFTDGNDMLLLIEALLDRNIDIDITTHSLYGGLVCKYEAFAHYGLDHPDMPKGMHIVCGDNNDLQRAVALAAYKAIKGE